MKFTPDSKKVIKELENIRDICNAKYNMAIGKGKVAWAGYANTADDAIALLKEQQEQIEKLIEESASNAEMAEGMKELLKEQEAVVRCKDCAYALFKAGVVQHGHIVCTKPFTERWQVVKPDNWFCGDWKRLE